MILILLGKILDDDKQISEYGIKEGDFLVLMVTKVCTGIQLLRINLYKCVENFQETN